MHRLGQHRQGLVVGVPHVRDYAQRPLHFCRLVLPPCLRCDGYGACCSNALLRYMHGQRVTWCLLGFGATAWLNDTLASGSAIVPTTRVQSWCPQAICTLQRRTSSRGAR